MPQFTDPEHQAIYGVVLDIRGDMLDLKQHVNEELEVQKETLALKADRKDLTLFIIWKQSPTWLKFLGAAITAATVVGAAVINLINRFP